MTTLMPHSLMKGALPNVLHAIGNTPIIKLNRVGADLPANIYEIGRAHV